MVVVSHAVVGPEEQGLLSGESCRVPDAGVRDLDVLSKSSGHQPCLARQPRPFTNLMSIDRAPMMDQTPSRYSVVVADKS